jgi:hypothetical protein
MYNVFRTLQDDFMIALRPAFLFIHLIWLSFSLASCSTVEVRQGPVVKAHHIILLPIESLHLQLQDSGQTLYPFLQKELAKKRFNIIDQAAQQFGEASDHALAMSGAVYDPAIGRFLPIDRSVYIKALIDFYGQSHDFDVIILPELLIRSANVSGDVASWDGVERKIELTKPVDKPYRALPTIGAVSVKLTAYSRQGAVLLHSYAGVALPYTIDYNTKPAELQLKPVLFSEKEQKQAAQLAVQPIFQQVKYRAK